MENELPTRMSSYLFGFKEVRTYFTLRFTIHIFNDICLYILQCILAVTVSSTVLHASQLLYTQKNNKQKLSHEPLLPVTTTTSNNQRSTTTTLLT